MKSYDDGWENVLQGSYIDIFPHDWSMNIANVLRHKLVFIEMKIKFVVSIKIYLFIDLKMKNNVRNWKMYV